MRTSFYVIQWVPSGLHASGFFLYVNFDDLCKRACPLDLEPSTNCLILSYIVVTSFLPSLSSSVYPFL